MSLFPRYNDGTSAAPRLRVGHALWSLIGLPMNGPTEWTLDEKFERVKAAGFEHVECWLGDDNEAEVKAALDRHGLRLILGHRPFSRKDVETTIERAVRLEADFAFCQPASAFTPLADVVDIVRHGAQVAGEAGRPFFVETHRNNYTENIPQTLALIEAVPEIRITADLSHFVVVGEFYGWDGEGAIERKHLPAFMLNGAVAAVAGRSTFTVPVAMPEDADSVRFTVGTTVEEAEKGLILRTLEHTRNNKTRAAEILGISLKTLHNKLKEYGAAKEEEAGAQA